MFPQNAVKTTLAFFVVVTAIMTLIACGGPPKPEEAIIGLWEADLGSVSGLGNIIETTEFYEDGTVTSRTKATSFVGNWKFISEDTLRIDWKEQGIFGHSPIQIYKVSFENANIMRFTEDEVGRTTVYMRPEARQNMLAEQTATEAKNLAERTTAEALQAQGVTAPGTATNIIGTWKAINPRTEAGWDYEFTFDQFGNVTLVNENTKVPGEYWSASGKDGEKGKYRVINDNEIRIEVKGPGMPSPGENKEERYHYKFRLDGDTLSIETILVRGTTEFQRIK